MSLEVTNKIEKLGNTFSEFVVKNDQRLKEIEAKGRADPLLEEQVNKLSAAVGEMQAHLDEVTKKAQRPGLAAPGDDSLKAEHRKMFSAYLRRGEKAAAGLADLQAKVSVGDDTEGGYAAPETLDTEIERYERDNSPMREVCRQMTLSNEEYRKLVSQGGAGSGWVGEEEARTETDTPTLAELRPYFGEIYAEPKTTQKALDDLAINVEAWLAEEVGIEFAEQENDAYTKGNGVKKPKGILSHTLSTDVDGTRAFDAIQKIVTGSSGNFVADKMLDVVHALKRGYRNGAIWMVSNLGLAEIRKLKDGDGNYLWRPGLEAGSPSTILGYGVVENDDMPDPAADANALIFGNFQRGYCIYDVQGVRVLRDNVTSKPYVKLYTTKRVGGRLIQDRAFKVLTLSA